MLTKAIIEGIENNGLQARVRIPILHKVAGSSSATPYAELPVAPVCYAPGCKPYLKKGDIVYVEFENNNFSSPVVLGQLLLETSDSQGTLSGTSLNVEVDTKLSSDTTIGDVTSTNISHLLNTKGNIQGQLDVLTELVSKVGIYDEYFPQMKTPTQGWYRLCKLGSNKVGYFSCIGLTYGSWSSGSPSLCLLHLACQNNTVKVKQLAGIAGGAVTKVRLTGAKGTYYLELYNAGLASGTMSKQGILLLGNVKCTEEQHPTSPNGEESTYTSEITLSTIS